jgi:hypothetical protein
VVIFTTFTGFHVLLVLLYLTRLYSCHAVVTNYRRLKIISWSCLQLHTFVSDTVEVYVAVLKVKHADRQTGRQAGRQNDSLPPFPSFYADFVNGI